ncbi:hypothetical protein [Seinonella peptonophila]|uniref:hypothetical protein n=1 Tax=Seinonella peptonophila TaxID=112248 RepID=UPI001114AF58|nr:hypothetical protein [Seinonella peptonophila]
MFRTRPPASAIRQSLCHDLTDKQATQIINSFAPESRHLFTDRIDFSIPNVATLYVKLTNDLEFPPLLQDQMIANLAPQSVEQIEAGHLPMLSHSQHLGLILRKFINEMDE